MIEVVKRFGWEDAQVLDLGDISQARATEMYLSLWVRLYEKLEADMCGMQLLV